MLIVRYLWSLLLCAAPKKLFSMQTRCWQVMKSILCSLVFPQVFFDKNIILADPFKRLFHFAAVKPLLLLCL